MVNAQHPAFVLRMKVAFFVHGCIYALILSKNKRRCGQQKKPSRKLLFYSKKSLKVLFRA